MDLESDRNLYQGIPGVVTCGVDVSLETPKDLRRLIALEARRLEVGGKAHLQHVLRLIRRTERLRIGTGQRHERRIEVLPDAGVGVAPLESIGVESRNAFQVGKGRHVHDGETRLACLRHAPHQLSNAARAVLRLLHAEDDQVEC